MNLYRNESSDPLRDAQANLDRRTYYVSDSTLRFHYSRVLHAEVLADGLLYGIVESVAIDPDNKRRGYRAVLFDIFGTVLTRSSLEDTRATKAAAMKDLYAAVKQIDPYWHTLDAISKYRISYAAELDRLAVKVHAMRQKEIAA